MSKIKSQIDEIKKKLSVFFEKVGALTKIQRLLIVFGTFILIGGAYYYFIFMPKFEELKKAKQHNIKQVAQLATYKQRASKLKKYEKLMRQSQEEFKIAKKALPDKRELPSLLTGISRAGSDAGLAFHLFAPDKEINKGFLNEIPISVKVEGRYHQITDFFYQIIQLNRIVMINDVNVKSKNRGEIIEMRCKAVTYMFFEKKDSKGKNKKK